jgi:hypothetical protein
MSQILQSFFLKEKKGNLGWISKSWAHDIKHRAHPNLGENAII